MRSQISQEKNFFRAGPLTQIVLKKTLDEVLFYVNTVANLFPVGFPQDEKIEGCVLPYAQQKNPEFSARNLTLSSYLQCPVGCCSDFGLILNKLLRANGFRSNVVGLPGHWLVEVQVDDVIWTVDSMYNYAYNRSLFIPLKKGQKVKVFLISHPGLKFKSEYYRRKIAVERIAYLIYATRARPMALGPYTIVPGYELVNL